MARGSLAHVSAAAAPAFASGRAVSSTDRSHERRGKAETHSGGSSPRAVLENTLTQAIGKERETRLSVGGQLRRVDVSQPEVASHLAARSVLRFDQ